MDPRGLQFATLYGIRFALSFGFVTLVTLLPTYIELLEASGLIVGLFISSYAIARSLGAVLFGWVADRFGKRRVLVVSILISALSYVLFPQIETTTGFILVRFLQGLGIVGMGMVSLAMVGELASKQERASRIGTYNAWRFVAAILGTLGAGTLYELYGFPIVFGLLAVVVVLPLPGIGWFLESDDNSVGFAFGDLALNRRILTLTGFRVQYAFSVILVRNWIPILVGVSAAKGGLGASAIVVGAVIALEKGVNMVGQPIMGRLSDRYGRAVFVFLGGGLYGLLALMIPLAPGLVSYLGLPGGIPLPYLGSVSWSLVPILVLNAFLGLADSMREPASMALFADEGSGQGITSSFGIRELVWRPGEITAPLIGGVLMSHLGMNWVFIVGGITALSGVLTFYVLLACAHGNRALAEW